MASCDRRRAESEFDEGDVSPSQPYHSLAWLMFFLSFFPPSALAAAARSLCQDPSSDEERKGLEDVLQKCADNEIQRHAARLAALPFQLRYPSHERSSVVSSLASTPFTSTLVSRSTSRTSGTDSLPVTPGTELPIPLDIIDAQRITGASTAASQFPTVSHATSFDLRQTLVADDVEARLSHMEQLVDLYLLSHHRHRAAHGTALGVDPLDGSFSDRFVDELFEEGDAAKSLIELQRCSPKKGIFLRP